MNRTRGSKHSMRIGLVRMTVTMWLKSVCSNSIGATKRSSPVSLRSLRARCFRITGPYVSGRKTNSGHVAPARIAPTQNPHAHDTTEIYPAMGGPRIGPNVVAAINIAMLRPRLFASW